MKGLKILSGFLLITCLTACNKTRPHRASATKTTEMDWVAEENLPGNKSNASIWAGPDAENKQYQQDEDDSFIDELSGFIKKKKNVIR